MRVAVLGGCLAVVALASSSCEEYGPRIYTARLYRVGARCLEPYTPIGVVQAGELRATCERQCLSLDAQLFVSTVCPPLPARVETVNAEVPVCALALGAFDALATCGVSDAGVDGGFDGGLDASAPENAAGG